MATADDLIAWHNEDHPGMVEVTRIVTTTDDGSGAAQVILLEAAAAANDDSVTITQLGTDGGDTVMDDCVHLTASEMTALSVAWLERCGYTVTPPATA